MSLAKEYPNVPRPQCPNMSMSHVPNVSNIQTCHCPMSPIFQVYLMSQYVPNVSDTAGEPASLKMVEAPAVLRQT